MKNEDYTAFRHYGQRLEGGIHTAVELWYGPIAWCRDPATAKAQYGPIASWDTSEITNMKLLFFHKPNFNDDISRWDVSSVWDTHQMFDRARSFNGDLSQWDVSNVKSMEWMFEDATSFTHQLGGAWSTSTAHKGSMFRSCPGSIAGKTNDFNGTPE